MVGHLQAGRPGQLVRLAGDERREVERGVETRRVELAGDGGDGRRRERLAREDRCRGAIHRGGRWGCRPRGGRRRGARGRGRRGWRGIRHRIFDVDRGAGGRRRQRHDAGAEALANPLQHEAVGGGQFQRAALGTAGERLDPRDELLRRQLALERLRDRRSTPEGKGQYSSGQHVGRRCARGGPACRRRVPDDRAGRRRGLWIVVACAPVIHRGGRPDPAARGQASGRVRSGPKVTARIGARSGRQAAPRPSQLDRTGHNAL